MKNQILAFSLAIVFSTPLMASKEYVPNYSVDSSNYTPSLNTSKTKVRFSFTNLPTMRYSSKMIPVNQYEIIYAYGGKNETVILTREKNWFELTITPGNYAFQLYYTDEYEEITTHSIELKPQYSTFISCNLNRSSTRVTVEKPVIYLYPSSPTDVKLELLTKGKMLFTYPNYENEWNVMAQPSGELKVNNKTYNYLFWEAEQTISIHDIDITKGFTVSKENTIAFLEEKLSTFGLTSKEQADFITYWAPRMMNNEINFVQFMFNDDCNAFAELNISPQPKQVHRIYILYTDYYSGDYTNFKPQEIPTMKRQGFTVVEWGGVELNQLILMN